MNRIDLHVHSNCSDGTLTPTGLVHHAKELGLTAFALTDHDTTAGLTEAVHAGLREGIDVVPGIEFSTEYRGKDIHILGYCFDYEAEDFQRRIREFADARDLRNRRMCEKLCSAGFPVPYEELMAENKGSIVTRAQFAAYMVQHGIVASREEAFDHYIGDDCPYFVPREKITPEMAVRFLLDFHGVPVLAHPYQYGLPEEELEQLLSHLKSAGLMGLECIYSRYPEDQVRALTRLADQFGLLVTGGSDYHGANKPGLEMGTGYGQLFVPEQCLTALRRTLYHTDEETQVFFADLDGTLLNSEKTVSPRTMDALRRWCAAGNLLVLSSGRALYDCQQVLEELPLRELPGVYIEACNGALLYDCSTHQIIYREGIPRAMLNELFNDCRAHGVYVHTYTDRGIAVRLYRKETKFYQRYHHMTVIEAGLPADSDFVPDAADEEARRTYYADPSNCRAASAVRFTKDGAPAAFGGFCENPRTNPAEGDITKVLTQDPCKCIAIELDDPERIEALEAFLRDKYQEKLDVFMSNEWYLEIISRYAGKGQGLTRFCRTLGIPVSHSLAAGDSENDISMLRAAGTGIAMCNGIPQMPDIEKAADAVTLTDNDHDGLVPFLEQAMNVRR